MKGKYEGQEQQTAECLRSSAYLAKVQRGAGSALLAALPAPAIAVLMVLLVLLSGCAAASTSANDSAPQSNADVVEAPPAQADAANEPLPVANEGQVPFYARISADDIFHDDQWAVIVFYRPPGCIPDTFNLLNLFHFPSDNHEGAFACSPPTTSGVEYWKNDPETDAAPLQAEFEGGGATPVWFVSWPALEEEVADGKLTISDLEHMPSLLAGTAASYKEYLRPGEVITFTAEGALQSGRTFAVNVHDESANPRNQRVNIEIDGAEELQSIVESRENMLRVENEGEVPFYARIAADNYIHNEELAVIVFYRPPECIPSDFNLLKFFDFPGRDYRGAFGCSPPTTSGTEYWENGPDSDSAPKRVESVGAGATPVWFVSWPELQEAVADGTLTIADLQSLPSLRIGTAASYKEFLRPEESNEEHMVTFTAEGAFEDGGTFKLDVHSESAEPANNYVVIEIDE